MVLTCRSCGKQTPDGKLCPANPDVLFIRALLAEVEGRWDDALALYEEVRVIAPQNRSAAEGADRMRVVRTGDGTRLPALDRLANATALLRAGDAARGLKSFDDLLASDFPYPVLLRLLKGRGLLRLGRAEDALAWIDDALRRSPDDPSAWTARAEALLARGDLDGATAAADEALKRDGHDPAAWTARGEALLRRKQFADALECFAKATAIDARFGPAWGGKAQAEEGLGRAADMKASTEAYVALPSDSSERRARAEAKLAEIRSAGQALLNRQKKARQDADKGDAAAAIAALDDLLPLVEPREKPLVWYWKGRALARLGRFDEALAAHDRSIALGVESAAGWKGKADVYERRGDDAKALEFAEAALQRAPTDAGTLAIKGHCLRRANRLAEALEVFEQALGHFAGDARARLGKAQAEDALGKPAALQSYLNFLELKPTHLPEETALADRRVGELRRGRRAEPHNT